MVAGGAIESIKTEPCPMRLSRALFTKDVTELPNFAPLPSNEQAIQVARHFVAGINPFALFIGPSGWGKTHLLNVIADAISAQVRFPARVENTKSWLSRAEHWDSPGPLLLDDSQDVFGSMRARQELRRVLERRLRSRRPTALAFNSAGARRSLRTWLPCFREWSIAQIDAPSLCERRLLVHELARLEGMTITGELEKLIACKAKGDARTLIGALRRLQVVSLSWNRPSENLRACGLLMPMLSDSMGWDIRDFAHETVTRWSATSPAAAQLGIDSTSWCIWAMHSLMGINEDDIASYYRRTAGSVYALSQQIESRLRSTGLRRECVDALTAAIDQTCKG